MPQFGSLIVHEVPIWAQISSSHKETGTSRREGEDGKGGLKDLQIATIGTGNRPVPCVPLPLLERMDADDIAAELETRSCLQCTGDKTCFVGSSAELTEIMHLVCERLVASDRFAQSPPVGKLYIVGLASFRTAEDKDLVEAYRRIAGEGPRRAKKN